MKFVLLCAFMFYYASGVTTAYDGNNLLVVLGQSNSSQAFKDFTKYWLLDKDFENRNKGLKVYINPITEKIESITLTGDVPDLRDIKSIKYHAKLPLDLSLDDDTSSLYSKLGPGEKLIGRSTVRFHCGGLTIDATYGNLKTGKITYLAFSNQTGNPLVINDIVAIAKKQARPGPVAVQPAKPATVAGKPVEKPASVAPLKKAIMEVFKASRDSAFDPIKMSPRNEGNFWNYKFTYNTKIKIPGEKYNLLYSFPFITSPLDFVSVLKESDGYDKSFDALYHDFEKQLTLNFPASEGWIATCLPAKDKNQLPNLEFRNDKYGAIILDHTRNPAGRHVLYLRFLLFAD